jgi:hypothetical protein
MKAPVSLPRPALRKSQVARILGICEPLVADLIVKGHLRAFKPTPDTVRVLPSDLEDFIAARANIPPKPFSAFVGLVSSSCPNSTNLTSTQK